MANSTDFVPTCSVVVCTRNRPEALNRCLEALVHMAYPHFEVVVVDNAPSDSRTHAVAERWGVRYLVEPVAGLSRARNTGAGACSSEVVAFTDDDAVPEREWLSRLVEEFRDPHVTVVTGRTLPLLCGSDTPNMAEYTSDLGPERIRLDRSHPLWFGMACFGGIGRGCNMAFRRSVFDVSSVFDERLGKGVLANGDEHRAFGQLIAHGHKATYTPEAVVRHPSPQTLGELRAQYLLSLSDLTGYATFLFLETGFRWKVTKYVFEAALGTKRTWRFQTGKVPPGLVPRWRMLLAYLTGSWHCLQAHLRPSQPHASARPDHTIRKRASAEASVLRLTKE